MKTLIFNGSPRKNGDTAALITSFLRETAGYPDDTYKIVTAYDAGIQPCRDCRYCRNHPGCSIQDSMEDIYAYIQECDNILIASPIYFSQLTGPLLCVASRLQTYWSARFFVMRAP